MKGLRLRLLIALGLHIPKQLDKPLNQTIPADGDPEKYKSSNVQSSVSKSSALSMANTVKNTIRTRKIAILAADGVNENNLMSMIKALTEEGAIGEVIAPKLGFILGEKNTNIPVYKSFLTSASVFYDAVYVPEGINSVATLEADPDAIHFLNEAFKHCKAIAADAGAVQVLRATYFGRKLPEDNNNETVLTEGVIIHNDVGVLSKQFIAAIALHRFWEREKPRKVPA